MRKEIDYKGKKISYEIRKSRRARRVRLSVSCNSGVRLTVPWWAGEKIGEEFVRQKIDWILKKTKFFQNKKPFLKKTTRQDYLRQKELARKVIKKRLEHFNKIYNFSWNRISIKNTSSRWGSCSEKGNLNFSYCLIHLPEELRDYVVVHELCHLGELNHSVRFWNLVARTVPDYRGRKRELKNLFAR